MFNAKIGFALAALAISSAASAQGYVGFSAGQSSTNFNTGDYTLGLPNVSETQDKTKTAFKLFAGYDFTKNWAIEGGYADLGKPQYNYTGIGAAAGFAGQAQAKESSWFVAGKGTLPINDQFNLFGKLGATWNKVDVTLGTNNAVINAAVGLPATFSKTKTDVLVGVGAEYNFNKQLGLRFEYEDFGKFGDSNNTPRSRASMWSLGLSYKF